MMRSSPRSSLRDADKFADVHQVGGIRTGTIDAPGGAAGVRVAHVDTGSGLRFTIALDRGGDIVDAFFDRHGLAYLTPNGYRPPSPAYHLGDAWLVGWIGGLLTTCGPRYIGDSRQEEGEQLGLHGHHSSTPALVESVVNPDPVRGRRDMSVSMIIRDTRMFGPVIEVRREIRCTLGEPAIHIDDEVTNRGNTVSPHHWLYHVNAGFPLLDRGARLVYRGKKTGSWNVNDDGRPLTAAQLHRLKQVPAPRADHAGAGGRLVILDSAPDQHGLCHVGLINNKLALALELEYPAKDLPRLANWQHYAPAGSYITGIEPFAGSLLGKAKDSHPLATQKLQPGQSRRYRLTLRVHEGAKALAALAKHDGAIT